MRDAYRIGLFLTTAVLLLGYGSPASATVIYSYAGNPFTDASGPYTESMSVSASFTLANPLPGNLTNFDVTPLVIAFSATDGVHAATQLTQLFRPMEFLATTDQSGAVIEWGIDLVFETGVGFLTCNLGLSITSRASCKDVPMIFGTGAADLGLNIAFSDSGSVADNPGIWTTTIPEPTTALLVMLGLVVIATERRSGT